MMILPIATFLLLQGPSLDEAVVEASALAATGAWAEAETLLRDAGVEQSTHGPALAIFGRCFLRNVETRAGTGELAGLEVNDAFLDANGEVVGTLTIDPYDYDGVDPRTVGKDCDWED